MVFPLKSPFVKDSQLAMFDSRVSQGHDPPMRRRARGNATLPARAGSKFSKNPPIVLPVYPAVSLVN